MTRIKKAVDGEIIPIKRADLRTGQYRRLGRLSAKKPVKAKKVAARMVEKATRTERGEQYIKKNLSKFTPEVPSVGKRGVKVKKMAKGGALGMKSVKAGFDKNPGVTRADIIVAAKGQARGGKRIMKKAQDGKAVFKPSITVKKSTLDSVLNKRKASMDSSRADFKRRLEKAKSPKKMMGGGKCRGGCY